MAPKKKNKAAWKEKEAAPTIEEPALEQTEWRGPAPRFGPHVDVESLLFMLDAPASAASTPADGSRSVTGGGTRILGGGTRILGDGTRILGDGTRILGGGTIILGDGTTILRDGSTTPGDGSTILGDGTTIPGDGSTILGDGSGKGLGYIPDLTDHRDYSYKNLPTRLNARISGKLTKLFAPREEHPKDDPWPDGRYRPKYKPWPGYQPRVHLGDFKVGPPPETNLLLLPVEDQGPFQSCSAHAVIGMVEYLVRKAQEKEFPDRLQRINLSRLFLYKATRQLLGWSGDTGAYLRKTIQALALFGAPPEEYWPYNGALLNAEPPAFQYSYAQAFKALAYLRLDDYNSTGEDILDNVRRTLADEYPVVFGFPIYRSMVRMKIDPAKAPTPVPGEKPVPLPSVSKDDWPYVIPPPEAYPYDTVLGGHAVLAVGYDDDVKFRDFNGKVMEPGALIIRNSWGRQWGDNGFAYLPYSYVTSGLAADFWTVYSQDSFSNFLFGPNPP